MKSTVLRVRAKGSGKSVDWLSFKAGKFVPNSRLQSFLTSVLPDVISETLEILSKQEAKSIEIVFPNGFTTASFDMVVTGDDFKVLLGRRLVRGLFPLNPIAAEFGSNFDVLVFLSGENPVLDEIQDFLVANFEHAIF
jgi:hypothetical protein